MHLKEYIFVIFNVKLPNQSCPYPQFWKKDKDKCKIDCHVDI
jgi:hypothetical protein